MQVRKIHARRNRVPHVKSVEAQSYIPPVGRPVTVRCLLEPQSVLHGFWHLGQVTAFFPGGPGQSGGFLQARVRRYHRVITSL